jgi:hypothetical protein
MVTHARAKLLPQMRHGYGFSWVSNSTLASRAGIRRGAIAYASERDGRGDRFGRKCADNMNIGTGRQLSLLQHACCFLATLWVRQAEPATDRGWRLSERSTGGSAKRLLPLNAERSGVVAEDNCGPARELCLRLRRLARLGLSGWCWRGRADFSKLRYY